MQLHNFGNNMIIEKLIEEEKTITSNIKVIPVTKKLLREIKHIMFDEENYKYIEFVHSWYDDKETPNLCNWQDVEGHGYGWLWVDTPEEKWHKKIASNCAMLLKKPSRFYQYAITWEKDGFLSYRLLSSDGKTDVQILVGNDLNSNLWYI